MQSGLHVEEKGENETIVAFFAGTNFDLPQDGQGYVTQETMGFTDTSRKRKIDSSLKDLNECLIRNQDRFAYDGCHRRGGRIFAFGTSEPAKHLHQKLQEKSKLNPKKKFKLVLTAHSRGCITALKLAKAISEDKSLKDRVDIILDLRDPVPGNFRITAEADSVEVTATRKVFDLRGCVCIKKVHITVLEKGYIDPGFNVLIPRFSPDTQVEIEALPGEHNVQERNPAAYVSKTTGKRRELDYKNKSYNFNYALYLLGICKSQKIYSENGIDVNRRKCLEIIKNVLGYEHILCSMEQFDQNKRNQICIEVAWDGLKYKIVDANNEIKEGIVPWENLPGSPGNVEDIINRQSELMPRIVRSIVDNHHALEHGNINKTEWQNVLNKMNDLLNKDTIDKKEFEEFLDFAQLKLYDCVLKDYQNHPRRKILSRDLHLGGAYRQLNPASDATHLNLRHALLGELHGAPRREVRLFQGFKGRRRDISQIEQLLLALTKLKSECHRYIEDHKNKPDKKEASQYLGAVRELYACFREDQPSASYRENLALLDKFAEKYNKHIHLLAASKDSRTRQFFNAVGNVFVSLFSVGIYAGVRVAYSYHVRKSVKFWKTKEQILAEKMSKQVDLSKNGRPHHKIK